MRQPSPHPEERRRRVSKDEGGTRGGAADPSRLSRTAKAPQDEVGGSGAHASSFPGLILVGKFGAPQGVRGQIRVQSFTADPLAIGNYGALGDSHGAKTFALRDLRVVRDNLLVATVAGVTDRDAAAALTGVELFARRDALPPPEEDEVYLVDLIGCVAFDEVGSRIGTVIGVENFGAGDILEIAPEDPPPQSGGGGAERRRGRPLHNASHVPPPPSQATGEDRGETLLVPFTKAFVPVVDVAAKRVVIIVPPEEDDAR